jgi:hypothetical protein
VELLLQSFVLLEKLDLHLSLLTVDLARALAHHPSLSSLFLTATSIEDSSALSAILSTSKSISLFSFQLVNRYGIRIPLKYMQHNVHLLATDVFGLCDMDSDYVKGLQMKYKHEARNRRLLHNWQCICVLLASYRANKHSPIRDSVLSLMMDVMHFLVPDEWYVERRG